MYRASIVALALLAYVNAINVGELSDRVKDLTNSKIPQAIAEGKQNIAQNALKATEDATKAAQDAMQAEDKRINDLVETIAKLRKTVSELEGKLDTVTSNVETKQAKLQKDVTDLAASSKKQSDDKIEKAVTDLTDKADDALKLAKAAGSPHFYVHWGSKNCKKLESSSNLQKPTKRYEGWLFSTQHNNAGGGVENLCLIDAPGAQGGHRTGGWHDTIRPIRIEHAGHYEGGLRQVGSRIVPCSTCYYPKTCYQEWGYNGCSMEGYSPIYTGFGIGAYHNHGGNNDRICVDRNPVQDEWNNRNYYAGHMYPTQTHDRTGKRSGGTTTEACSVCCKE